MDVLGMETVAALGLLVVAIMAIWAVKSLVIVVSPNRAGVITGRKRGTEDGNADEGMAVFALEKLPDLLEIGADAVEGVDIDRLVVVDSGDGRGVANAANQRVNGAYGFLERMAASVGVDVEELVQGLMARIRAEKGREARGDGRTGTSVTRSSGADSED